MTRAAFVGVARISHQTRGWSLISSHCLDSLIRSLSRGRCGADPGELRNVNVHRSSTFGNSDGGLMSTVAERCWAVIPPSTLITSPVM